MAVGSFLVPHRANFPAPCSSPKTSAVQRPSPVPLKNPGKPSLQLQHRLVVASHPKNGKPYIINQPSQKWGKLKMFEPTNQNTAQSVYSRNSTRCKSIRCSTAIFNNCHVMSFVSTTDEQLQW